MILRLQEVELLLDPLDRLHDVELERRWRGSAASTAAAAAAAVLAGGAGWAGRCLKMKNNSS